MWNLPTTNIGYQFQKMSTYCGPNKIFLQAKFSLQAASLWALMHIHEDATLWRSSAMLEAPWAEETQWGDGGRQGRRSGKVFRMWWLRWALKDRQEVSSLVEQEILWMEAIPGGRTECETNQRGRCHLQLACCFDHWSRHEQKEFKQQISKAHLSHFHVWGSGAPSPYDPTPWMANNPRLPKWSWVGPVWSFALISSLNNLRQSWEFDQHRLLGTLGISFFGSEIGLFWCQFAFNLI